MDMRNGCIIFAVILICCCYAITSHFATSFVNEGIGYTKGNRARVVAVIKLELTMALFSLFTYLRLMAFVNANDALPLRMKRSHTQSSSDMWRFAAWLGIIIWLLLAHIAYPLYWAEHWLQSILFDISLIALGIWNHVVVILFGLFCVSIVISVVDMFSTGRSLMKVVFRCTLIRWLFAEPRAQIFISIIAGIFISFVTFLFSNMLIVKEQVFFIRNLPQEANGIRFALISDIHAGAAVREEHVAKIVDRINSENVDAIFLVGDLVDSSRFDIWHRLTPLKYLQSKFGSFYVTGNHEYYYGNALDWVMQFRKFGIHVLDNRSLNVSGLCIAGVNDYSSGRSGIENHHFNAVHALHKCDQMAPVIVLSHNPASAKEIAFNPQNFRADLILSGHTHGGQFYTIAPFAFLILPYFYGVYHISPNTQLFVSAGTLYQGPPMKMLAMSEIWVITLKPNASNY